MRFTKLTWIGLVCIAVASTTFGAWFLWLQTRIDKPVSVPVSLTTGRVHIPEFRINLSGPYEISVEAKKRIPFDTLNCLLGMSTLPAKCDQQPVVQASWVVTSDGVVIAKGTSDAERGGAWANDTIAKQIGGFEGKRNRRYSLDVDFTADGSVLRATDPHLVVGITSDFYEGSIWMSYFLFLGCSGVAIIGLLLLAASGARLMYQNRRKKVQPTAS
jgi:hypothetical protein